MIFLYHFDNMDGPRGCDAKLKKSEKERQVPAVLKNEDPCCSIKRQEADTTELTFYNFYFLEL